MAMIEASRLIISGGTFNYHESQDPLRTILQTFGDKYVQNATHDNDDDLNTPKCHPGTRTTFLGRLSAWVEDTESPFYVTWIHGPAGAGKSAIARSLAELHRNRLLAGSFFFFRTDPRRNEEKGLVATLAYQIACHIPDTRSYIANAIASDPSICSRSLQTQFKTLILEPLEHFMALINFFRPMLIIIDGLDECLDQDARKVILQVIFDGFPHLHGVLKFLVVSRPEHDIERCFRFMPVVLEKHLNTIELLGDLQAYDDVRLYFRDNFRRIQRTHPLGDHFPSNWPSDDAIERLVEKSSGFFIYASTIIKYIENDFDQPEDRLDIVLNLRTTSQKPYATLDALYLNILTSSKADHNLLVNIFSIVVLDGRFEGSLSLDEKFMKTTRFIESVLVLQRGILQLTLLDLKSLVEIKGLTIQFFHKSFSDFLLDPSRSNRFYANPAQAYTVIAKTCLRLLSDKTGLLEKSWLGCTFDNPRLEFHQLLNICCHDAAIDLDLQAAMMKYEFSLIPPDHSTSSRYFGVFCSCLRNYQVTSVFKETKVAEHLRQQFDNYLISELRRWVPLNSKIMDALRKTITPLQVDWETYNEIICKNSSILPNYDSCFLHYMYYEGSPDGEAILKDFFYSKDRADEYYLGECMAESPISFTPSPDNNIGSQSNPKREGDEQMGRRKRRRLGTPTSSLTADDEIPSTPTPAPTT